jgi:hypothetical protein
MANYLVLESSDLSTANNAGAIEVPDGKEATLIEYEPTQNVGVHLHALGATNLQDVTYRLEYGQNISSSMEAPPGSYADPFSFTKEFGAPLTSDQTVRYTAVNQSGQSQTLVAVMHVETVSNPGGDA